MLRVALCTVTGIDRESPAYGLLEHGGKVQGARPGLVRQMSTICTFPCKNFVWTLYSPETTDILHEYFRGSGTGWRVPGCSPKDHPQAQRGSAKHHRA